MEMQTYSGCVKDIPNYPDICLCLGCPSQLVLKYKCLQCVTHIVCLKPPRQVPVSWMFITVGIIY